LTESSHSHTTTFIDGITISQTSHTTMSFKSTILAATALMASAQAHMIMQSPVPYSMDKVDSGPITASQFPCKSNLGFTVSKMNAMAVGEKQTLSFKGSAVHGGGSCQLSVTMDTEPTANSVFKVIKSIEGGCPGVDQAEKFDFELPASIPNGKATFAWTWFAKLSGGPEMYMNCAPIEVTGGASDKSAFEALPNMLVANIATSSCKSPTSKALKFPNPGAVLESANNKADVEDGTGDCGSSSGGTTPAQPSSPAGQPSSAPQSSAAAQPSPPAGGQSSAAAPPSAPSAPPSNPGGVFAPGASAAPSLTSTTLVTVTAAPTPAKPTVPASPGTGTPAQPSSPSTGGGSAPAAPGGAGSTCSANGAVVCNGEKQFGLCNNGNVVWQDVASGTACVNGVISKRSVRVARPRYNRKA
jgi:hypothetical protein